MKYSRLAAFLLILLLLPCLVLSASAAAVKSREEEDPVIADGVWMGGQDLSGLTVAEAAQYMNRYMKALIETDLTVVFHQPVPKETFPPAGEPSETPGETEAASAEAPSETGSETPSEPPAGEEPEEPEIFGSYTVRLGDLGITWDPYDTLQAASHVGQTGKLVERYKMLMDLKYDHLNLPLVCRYDEEAIRTFLTAVAADMDRDPVDAEITSTESGIFTVTDEIDGQTVNVEKTLNLVCAALDEGLLRGMEVVGVLESEKTERTGDELRRIQSSLGACRTNFTPDSPRGENIDKARGMINGTVLWPGESFATDEFLRPYTTALGWKMAPTYVSGNVIDDVGGGVCQVASTLYIAVFLAELQIDRRYAHSMYVTYAAPSCDATLATGSKDFVFTNDTDAPIYIEGRIDEIVGLVFEIWGEETRPPEREVAAVSDWKSTGLYWRPNVDTYIFEPNLNFFDLTEKQRVVSGSHHDSVRSQLWKVIYEYDLDADGNRITESKREVSRELVSTDTYNGDTATYRIGTKDLAVDSEGYPLKMNGSRQMDGREFDNNYVFLKDVVVSAAGTAIQGPDGRLYARSEYLVTDENGDPLTDLDGHMVLLQDIDLGDGAMLSDTWTFYLLKELKRDSQGVPVTQNGLFVPIKAAYTVTWIVDDRTETETYEEGAIPVYGGSVEKASDGTYTYTFAGWSPAIGPVTGDAVYTALYTAQPVGSPDAPDTPPETP